MLKRVAGIAGLLILWEIVARWQGSPLFPPFTEIIPSLLSLVLSGEIFPHILASLERIILGFSLAAIFGTVVGTAMAQSPLIDAIIGPVVDAIRPVAALTIFPMLILLLGLGTASKVAVIFWTAWPAILLNTTEGLRRVDESVQEAAQLDGADRWPLLRYVSFPLALPAVMTGLRIGMSGGWISLVSAEMLGSSQGLGYSILAYSQTFRFPEMYSIVIIIALLGLTMNVGLASAQGYVDYRLQGERYESPFLRYLDRASGFAVDGIRLRSLPRRRRSARYPLREL